MALEGVGSKLYINVSDKNAVAVIDKRTNSLDATWMLSQCKDNVAIAIDESTSRLFVGCRNDGGPSGVIDMIETKTGHELGTLSIGGFVDYVTFDEKHRRLFASCGAGSLYVYQDSGKGQYKLVDVEKTAPMAKTALLVPGWNRLFVAVPHNSETTAKVLVFEVH